MFFNKFSHPAYFSQSLSSNLRTYRKSSDKYSTLMIKVERKSSHSLNSELTAWLQVLEVFFLFFDSWWASLFKDLKLYSDNINHRRIVNIFKTYQIFYLNNFLSSSFFSKIFWINITQEFLMIFVSVVSGSLYDKKHLHILLYTDTFLSFFELILVSFLDQFVQIFLSLKICVELSFECLFVFNILIVSTYFSIKHSVITDLIVTDESLN